MNNIHNMPYITKIRPLNTEWIYSMFNNLRHIFIKNMERQLCHILRNNGSDSIAVSTLALCVMKSFNYCFSNEYPYIII